MFNIMPELLQGKVKAHRRTRIQTVVRSTLKQVCVCLGGGLRGLLAGLEYPHALLCCVVTCCQTKLPPGLNDILVAHPSPAAVSRGAGG
jgi:hypothetical protein